MSQLGDALFTTTQQKVLGLLYVQPEKSFYIKEILRMTGMGLLVYCNVCWPQEF